MRAFHRQAALAATISLCWSATAPAQGPVLARQWHTVPLTFTGPAGLSETSTTNPFQDFRMEVTWVAPNGQRQLVVPGYYAADGDAAETGAQAGTQWRALFVPDQLGTWQWQVSFVQGPGVAVQGGGSPVAFDGVRGTLRVEPSDAVAPDFRARGMLKRVGRRHLRFAGSGEWFLEVGVNSPENSLAFVDFDGTVDRGGVVPNFLHAFAPHRPHFAALGGGPTWRGNLGEGLLGAINYLGSQGMNSMLFLTFSGHGDGDDVWPWLDRDDPTRFDCSKLDQWQRVFEHASNRGLHIQLMLNETENESFFEVRDGAGEFSPDRRLYYREMVARFGHVLGLTWNLCEEIGWTTGTAFARGSTEAQRRAWASGLGELDPYGHPVIVHTYHNDRTGVGQDGILGPLTDPNNPAFQIHGAALQGPYDSGRSVLAPSADRSANNHAKVVQWVERSEAAGNPWLVGMQEQMPPFWGAVPDGSSRDPQHDFTRKDVLWGTFVGGGASVKHYVGYAFQNTSGDDLTLEDYTTRTDLWRQTRMVHRFFVDHLPFHRMDPADQLVDDPLAYCLAEVDEVYAVYRRDASTVAQLDLGTSNREFWVRWYDPKSGGDLQRGSVTTVNGPGPVSLGMPPANPSRDWVVLVQHTRRRPNTGCSTTSLAFAGSCELGGQLRARFEDLPTSGVTQHGMLFGLAPSPVVDLPTSIACSLPCRSDVRPEVWFSGATTLRLNLPNDPALTGAVFRAQGFVAKPCLEATPSYDLELRAPR